jgi:hypothetical protein
MTLHWLTSTTVVFSDPIAAVHIICRPYYRVSRTHVSGTLSRSILSFPRSCTLLVSRNKRSSKGEVKPAADAMQTQTNGKCWGSRFWRRLISVEEIMIDGRGMSHRTPGSFKLGSRTRRLASLHLSNRTCVSVRRTSKSWAELTWLSELMMVVSQTWAFTTWKGDLLFFF